MKLLHNEKNFNKQLRYRATAALSTSSKQYSTAPASDLQMEHLPLTQITQVRSHCSFTEIGNGVRSASEKLPLFNDKHHANE